MVTTFHDLNEAPLAVLSAIEWTSDRHYVKTEKYSGIVHDPNDWTRDVSDRRHTLEPSVQIITVRLETMQIVDSLPARALRKDQGV